jgi:hypothetical protein
MMMQMLEAAGLELLSDDHRVADADNPNGYFELEATRRLQEDASFLAEAAGRAVKIVAPLLRYLPRDCEYRVIFMERAIEEIMSSQRRMLERRGEDTSSGSGERALGDAFLERIRKIKDWIEDVPNVQVCYVAYRSVIDSPLEASTRIAKFLGETRAFGSFDAGTSDSQDLLIRMGGVVDPSLCRHRHDPRDGT